ncbi:HET-domain-containing protein [Lentithecium fluviatile CBS 122367]|uniref:HET-domain-containing protein n=1 Tax=Lentithecium fluviatile CBS 122367 TaxID=1168545 RepID=A0A6G1IL36_9PLEO|nr:HET-domain-containing protein [Lentithecium fluviatile CBS 122367]
MVSSDTLEPYRYRPLPDASSTRVLVLDPAPKRDSPLRCHLVEINLDTFDKRTYSYEALSYVWGEREGNRPIECEGKSLLVTPNCEHALRALRNTIMPRVLWVDAICIDQECETSGQKEKSHQIGMMGRIYQTARTVLVWLGESNPMISQFLEKIPKMVKYENMRYRSNLAKRYYGKLNYRVGLANIKAPTKTERSRDHELMEERSLSFKPLYNNPWFDRTWTTQEVVFAQSCLVVFDNGSSCHLIEWSNFYDAIDGLFLSDVVGHIVPETHTLTFKHNLRQELQLSQTLEADRIYECLENLFLMKATNDKDKIYAIYPILAEIKLHLPEPDYTKSIEVMCEDLTRALIEVTGNLIFLRQTTNKSVSCGKQLPSWVPDWVHEEDVTGIHHPYMPDGYEVQRSFPLHFPCPGHLELYGQPLSRVYARATRDFGMSRGKNRTGTGVKMHEEIVNEHMKDLFYSVLICKEWVSLSGVSTPGSKNYAQFDTLFNAMTLRVQTRRPSGFRPITTPEVLKSLVSVFRYPVYSVAGLEGAIYRAKRLKATNISNASTDWNDEIWAALVIALAIDPESGNKSLSNSSALDQLLSWIRYKQKQRAFFLTDDGDMGTCFHTVQQGDLIVLFKGTREPYVLREAGQTYRVISPAFIPDLMNLEKPLEEDITKMQRYTLI